MPSRWPRRRLQAAEQARAEAETLSELAGSDFEKEETLHGVLERARKAFRMESVALKVRQRGSGEWIDAEQAGWARPGSEATLRFDVPIGPHLRMVGRGPALFAEDQRILEAFAAAAQTAYEGRRLSGEAERGRELETVDRQRTALLAGVGHDLRTPLAGIKAAVSRLRQRTSIGLRATATSCWPRSRSPRTGSAASSTTCSTPAACRPAS